ncbi:MAG TPA: MarR family transcriptional regulator [Patescibacteria group bacterium]|nr:MarR family transcriptional regulator [Patescibacteria group bacterium]
MHIGSDESGDAQEERKALIAHMLFLGQMLSTETALFHQTAAAKYGLGITDMKTISVLMQEGPTTAGQLAKRLSLTTGAITNVVDRLGKRGILERMPDANDRRKVIVTVNYEKLGGANNAYRSMGETFERLLQEYSTEQLTFLVQFYKASIEIAKQEQARLATNDISFS